MQPLPFESGLMYILNLKTIVLSVSSMFHLAAIIVFHPQLRGIQSLPPPTTVKFNLFPPVKVPILPWDLNLVLNELRKTPFVTRGNCSLLHLSLKTLFLLPITSARRARSLGADPLYTLFYLNKVTLHPHDQFLLKISSECHMNQEIHQLLFYPKRLVLLP